VACTTEKIFIEKPQLYDVFVDNQNVCVSRTHQAALRLTRGDNQRFDQAMKRLAAGGGGGRPSVVEGKGEDGDGAIDDGTGAGAGEEGKGELPGGNERDEDVKVR
jgi:hypothetical protein